MHPITCCSAVPRRVALLMRWPNGPYRILLSWETIMNYQYPGHYKTGLEGMRTPFPYIV